MFSQTKSIREKMYRDFDSEFEIRRQFKSHDEVKTALLAFGKKYNVVLSTKNSHPKRGEFHFICKHGGLKHEVIQKKNGTDNGDSDESDEVETIDLTIEKEPKEEAPKVTNIKKPYNKSTQKFDCPVLIRIFNFKITAIHRVHNHPIPQNSTTYAIHRKQSPEIMGRIYSILASGHKDPVTSVMDTLTALGVKNIIKKDIQNIQTLFLKNEDGKEMYALITQLENLGYVVRIQVDANHEIEGLFFVNECAIKEARLWPEAVTIDATYKTNAHKLTLVNIVGTSNVTSEKMSGSLQTFPIAAAFVNSEKEQKYQWILEELREAVWPQEENFKLPSVFVTDNEQALRNAIETVFPESQHLLCSWHLWNTMETRLKPVTPDDPMFNIYRTEAEIAFQSIVSSYSERSYQKALDEFRQIVSVIGNFKDNGAKAIKYLDDTLLQDDEIERWVGKFANQHSHMGNRTSGRAESFHSGLKNALGHQSAAKLRLTAMRMHNYYEKKRADRYRKLEIESLSINSLTFNVARESRFANLRFKVVRFAMDKIRENLVSSLDEKFVSKGENCNCWDRVRYLLPCPCVVSRHPGVLPLDIVHERWRFEHDEDYEEFECEQSSEEPVRAEVKEDDDEENKGKQTCNVFEG